MRVGLFVAGTQKAGTTALDSYLRRHPAVQMADRKEPHHFDNETLDWSAPDHSALHAAFDWSDAQLVRGESTPVYSFWPPSLARIQAYNPDARLILLFRDPIERAYSHWRMEVSRRAESLSFSEAIREGRTRMDPDAPLTQAWRVASYVERGFYTPQVGRALALFPREQILFLRSDELADHPATVLDRVARFLGIDAFEDIVPIAEHVGNTALDPISMFDIGYLRGMFGEDLLEFSRLTGLDVSNWATLNREAVVR